MKIKSDFVTNSSSTAFILIRKSDLTEAGILRLLGIAEGSPLESVGAALYSHLKYRAKPVDKFVNDYYEGEMKTPEAVEKEFSVEVAERVRTAKAAGAKVEMGLFRSESDAMESLFCVDSFEIENDEYYLNALRCYW